MIILMSGVVGTLGLAQGLAVAQSCSGSTQNAIQCGADAAANNPSDTSKATDKVDATITTIVNILTAVVGIAAVIMIVISGYRYITSTGSSEKVASAKNTLIYAIIGIAVAGLAKIIAEFVLSKTT